VSHDSACGPCSLVVINAAVFILFAFSFADLFSHESGHLWHALVGWADDPRLDPFHVPSDVLSGGGFWPLSAAWPVLDRAQRERRLATTGLWARVRHPQYAGFIPITLAFLFQWPTLATLVMFPVLVFTSVRLAHREEGEAHWEEGEALWEFGAASQDDTQRTPRWIPRFGVPSRARTPAQ
jgi:protein-S-isoprenylcysteine O-methyltransferase Ste14